MPARLYAFVPEEQNLSNAEREQLIEGLERELDEYYEQKCGKGSLETYLIQNEIWHLSEINYQVRAGYQKYLREYYVDSTVRNYLLGIDRVKLRLIIENAQTLKGKWNAQNHPELLHDILFLRYHPNPAIAKRYEYTTDISKLVWDFRVKGSDICKQQILTVLEDIVQQKITMKECTRHLNGLKSVYEFCMQEQIEVAAAYFNENYNTKISIDAYAESLHVSTNWFIHNFRQYMGMSPAQYVLSLRMVNAQSLLEHTNYNVKEISEIVGYDNPLYFSRVFKKEIGQSPAQYRKLRGEPAEE